MSQNENNNLNSLPVSYNKNYIKVIPKDPNTIYVYWEITSDTKLNFQNVFGRSLWEASGMVLKIHNLSENKSYFVNVKPDSTSCYFSLPQSGNMINAEIGKIIGDEFFVCFASSNVIEMPGNAVLNHGIVQFVDVKLSRQLMSSVNTDEIYSHFGFNDVFKVLGPSSSEHTKYLEEHDFKK